MEELHTSECVKNLSRSSATDRTEFGELAVFYRANAIASWSKVEPEGAVYDGERFHFLADTFRDYAIVVPEPSQITFVIAVLVAVVTLLRRRVYD